MFEESQSVASLSGKVDELLEKFKDMREQNEQLRQELVSVKAQNEAKDIQIAKLQDELKNKDADGEEIMGKIEAVLGR